ncbi:MAG TPA: response regulator transcription factor [Thermoanaerobaculia bacterium]|nr:response regulator transcription factor [Thermoanaerobaculia bacterium]
MAEPISVLIVDDHFIVRKGLLALLSECDDITVVGEAANGREGVERAGELNPDVILMDLIMPLLDGVAATRAILEKRPEARILALTSAAGNEKVLEAVRAGALGYLSKSVERADLLAALHKVTRGEPWLPPDLTRRLLKQWGKPATPPETLTEREAELLRLVAKGLANSTIADRLHISEATVRTHLTHIFGKLGAANRVEATLFALRDGWTTLEASLEV